jgi:hypothetical protein
MSQLVAWVKALFQQIIPHVYDRAEQWKHIRTARKEIRQWVALRSAVGVFTVLSIGGSVVLCRPAVAAVGNCPAPRSTAPPATPLSVDGRAHQCSDFFLRFLGLFDIFEEELPDPGWVLVWRSDPTQLIGEFGVVPTLLRFGAT